MKILVRGTRDPMLCDANGVNLASVHGASQKIATETARVLAHRYNTQPYLLDALQGLGVHPEHGYCFCLNAEQIKNGHTGECREARAAIAAAEVKP